MTAPNKETKPADSIPAAIPIEPANERVKQYKIAIAALLAVILGMAVALVIVSVQDTCFSPCEDSSNVTPLQPNEQPDAGQFDDPQGPQLPPDGSNADPSHDPNDGHHDADPNADPSHDPNDGHHDADPEPDQP